MRCRAQLIRRLPPRSSRWRWVRPELAWSGATPPWRASCASLWKRSIGPISAGSFAAVRPPQPGSSSSAGAVCAHGRKLAVELADRAGQRAATADQVACDAHLHLWCAAGEPAADAIEPDRPVERARGHAKGWIELVQMPAQPLLGTPAFVDEIVAVDDQQLQLPVALLARAGPVEVRLP